MNKPIKFFLGKTIFAALIFAIIGFGQQNNEQNKQRPSFDKPNVLFISVDDLNDWTGFLGGHPQAKTPNLDQLASSGINFTHAYPPAPVCGPSRTAILYGRYPHTTGAYGNNTFYSPETLGRFASSNAISDVFRNQKSIATVFRENGYYTAGAGKLSHFSTHYHYPENAEYFEDDFDVYFNSNERIFPDPENPESDDTRLPIGPVAPEDEEKLLDNIFSNWGVEQLYKNHEKPFFLAIGFKKPHLPWVAPQSYFDKFNVDEIQLPEVPEDDLEDIPHAGKIFAQSLFGFRTMYPESDHQEITRKDLWKRTIRAYLASINYADAMVGKVLDALEISPYADNTIVVLWGDHGWHLGEKKHWRKMGMWETSARTPLIIRIPGNNANGQNVDHPVSLQDLFPTLAELCNLSMEQLLDGHSLAPLLGDPNMEWEKPVLMSHGPGNFAIRKDQWRYIRYQNGDEELYNLEEDPKEFTNLVPEEKYQQVIEDLGQYVPDEYVELYDHRFLQFANLDTMRVFIE